jgi:hypothetical protein
MFPKGFQSSPGRLHHAARGDRLEAAWIALLRLSESLLALLVGLSSGSGGVRLDLSQKGDLPRSGERLVSFGPRSPTRAPKGAWAKLEELSDAERPLRIALSASDRTPV